MDVGLVPAGAGLGDARDGVGGELVDKPGGDGPARVRGRGGRGGDHPLEGGVVAEDLDGLSPPPLPLLVEGSGFVFGVPGLQGGLLREPERLDRGGDAAVVADERGGEVGGDGLDGAAAAGPAGHEGGVDADEFADGSLAGCGGAVGEGAADALGDLGFEAGVVELGGGDLEPVEHPGVEGEPPAVEGLHLVRDRDVGVQVGVAGAGVPVGEAGGDQPAGVDLADAAGAEPGVAGVALQELEGGGDRGVVGGLDPLGDLGVGDRPQRGHRLHRGEGQVESGDRGRLRAGCWARNPDSSPGCSGGRPCRSVNISRASSVRIRARSSGGTGALAGRSADLVPGLVALGEAVAPGGAALVDLERRAEAVAAAISAAVAPLGGEVGGDRLGVGVDALPEQGLHLLLGDLPGDAERSEAAPPPAARRFAFGGVVVAERGVAAFGGV